MIVIQNINKKSWSIYGKNHSNDFFSGTNFADILQETYGAPPFIKQLKSFRSDHKHNLSVWGKFEKNDVKFRIHGHFELAK